MLWNKNDYFKKSKESEEERHTRLNRNWNSIIYILDRKKFTEYEIEEFGVAFEYFRKNPKEFDGASFVRDVYDISNLELSAMLHDYQYIVLLPKFKGLDWLVYKSKLDYQYSSNLRRLGNISNNLIAEIRYWLLAVTTPAYKLISTIS